MPLVAATAVALAAGLDLAVGEPPARAHPVAWFGRAVAPLDRDWRAPLGVGRAAAVVLPLSAAVVAVAATAVAVGVHPLAGAAVAGLALFSTTSRRMLLEEARGVVEASATDLPAARERLPALVGRPIDALPADAVRSAAVESAAENLADGLVAPLFAFALLAPVSLPLGVGAAVWVKAVNTMDSMLGYPGTPVGRASARLDDVVMWVPARLAAALLALAARRPSALRAARRFAGEPASPNSGWPMATLAAALGVRLEKPGAYVLEPAADPPTVADGRRGVRLVGLAGGLAFVGAGVLAWT